MKSCDDEWENHLQASVFAYNTTPHESTLITPFELVFKRRPYIPIDTISIDNENVFSDFSKNKLKNIINFVKNNQKIAQARQAKQHNENTSILKINTNDNVYIFFLQMVLDQPTSYRDYGEVLSG